VLVVVKVLVVFKVMVIVGSVSELEPPFFGRSRLRLLLQLQLQL